VGKRTLEALDLGLEVVVNFDLVSFTAVVDALFALVDAFVAYER